MVLANILLSYNCSGKHTSKLWLSFQIQEMGLITVTLDFDSIYLPPPFSPSSKCLVHIQPPDSCLVLQTPCLARSPKPPQWPPRWPPQSSLTRPPGLQDMHSVAGTDQALDPLPPAPQQLPQGRPEVTGGRRHLA